MSMEKYGLFVLACSTLLLSLCGRGFCLCGTTVVATTSCPEGWMGFEDTCYKFVTYPRRNQADARKDCAANYATLVRVDNLKQHKYISSWLEANSVNKSIEWYTSGIMNPAFFGRYVWEGHPLASRPFNNELMGLWKLKPMPEAKDQTTWPKGKTFIVYKSDGKSFGFDLAFADVLRPYICSIKKADVAKIGETQRNELFGVTDFNNVPRAPCFTHQPKSHVYFMKDFTSAAAISPGQHAVEFRCLATGNPRPTYSWYIVDSSAKPMTRKVINPLDVAYGGRYSITEGVFVINFPKSASVDPTGLNRIQCAAQNKYGAILSDHAELSFGAIADFPRTAPAPKTVVNQKMATLSCNPPDKLKPKSDIIYNFYQRRGETTLDPIIPQTRPYLFISQGGALYFSAVTMTDNGKYVCSITMRSATSGTNVQSQAMTLNVINTIAEPQMISIHSDFPKVLPENAFRDSDIRLECFAIGRPDPFTYSWKKIGGQISNRAVLRDLNRVLLIRNAQIEDNGDYECTVSQGAGDGGAGGTRRKRVTVSLNAKPYFITTLMSQFVDLGKDVTFVCEGSGKPNVAFVWYRGLTPLTNTGRYAITTSGTQSSQLVIKKVTMEDLYTYSCEITNLYGSSYSSAWLKVLHFAPNFKNYPLENREGMKGQELVYKCQAEGAPTPAKTWFKNGSPISTAEVTIDTNTGKPKCGVDFCTFLNGNLMIKTVKDSDQGNYTCEAKNTLGTARSSGYLSVMPAPVFTLEPENREIRVNTTVDIPCLAESQAHLDINYAWYFENQLLKFDRLDLDARRYDAAQLLRPYGRNFGSLRIENVQFENEGRYECHLSTPIGTKKKIAWIRVAGPPGPCAGVVAILSNSSDVRLRWVKGTSHHTPITSYIVEVARFDTPNVWTNVTTTTEPKPPPSNDFREATLTGLAANTSYLARVRAVNALGIGQASPNSKAFTTMPQKPFVQPQNVSGGGGKMTTLVVRWNTIPPAYYNGPDFMYIINHRDPANVKWTTDFVYPKNLKKLNQGKQLEHTFTLSEGTPDYTLFDIRVGSKNKIGEGPYSAVKKAYSAERVPTSTPRDVVATAYNSTALTVRWISPKPNPGEGVIKGYRIIYWPKVTTCRSDSPEKVSLGIRQIIRGNVNEGRIIGLKIDQYYCIVAQVYNDAGDGPESGVTEQTTFKRAPSNFPTLVKLHSTGRPGELYVTWVGLFTLPQEESLDGYAIRYWRTGSPTKEFKDVDYGLHTSGYLESLAYNTRYDLRVYGYSRGGVGTMSSPMIQFMLQTTQECIPGRYTGPDVEYWFLCSGCKHFRSSFTVLCLSFIAAMLYNVGF